MNTNKLKLIDKEINQMLVVMHQNAANEQIAEVVKAIETMGLQAHPLAGSTRTAIGVTGNITAVDPQRLASMGGVLELVRVTRPYKLASREMHPEDTVVKTPQTIVGGGNFTLIAGAYKPRTSPYSFQGMGREGLEILKKVRAKTGIGIVTELMDTDEADAVEDAADIIQIGTRNMQNYALLRRVGKMRKPILLKRGMSATLEEWLMAAEYILAGGNQQVLLCERGVRTFNDHSRNTLDLSVVPPLQATSHLPVLVDPSHGTGKRAYVPSMALAALASGADGLLLEIHPNPDKAASDGMQTIDFATFSKLRKTLGQLSPFLGKKLS